MSLSTPWTSTIDKNMPLGEYPRPQLQRSDYTCLNGMWDYQIVSDGKLEDNNWQAICVPYALGTPLSGVKQVLLPGKQLWYRKRFTYVPRFKKTLLNFGAVDQCCDVYINNQHVGSHQGGYEPFNIEITDALKYENELLVCCRDDSDLGNYIFGKQRLKNGGIWHKPTAGIWQTVWLESVTDHYVEDIKITPYFDKKQVYIHLEGTFSQAVITIVDQGKVITKSIINDKQFLYTFDDFIEWSPQNPHLYDVLIETEDDAIHSYFGMRKFSKGKDKNGNIRFMLNNKPIFLTGVLDQGYNSDGYLTYVSDEAIIYELTKVKEMGFNVIRKHAKIDSARWYMHCDELGILVLQDIPNGGQPYNNTSVQVKNILGINQMDNEYNKLGRSSKEGRVCFINELDSIVKCLYNTVSICSWVPFNEGWGQFDAKQITERISIMDNSRLIDHASGFFDQGSGSYHSVHAYRHKYHMHKDRHHRIELLSAFGGYTYIEANHQSSNKKFGYKKFDDKLQWILKIEELYRDEVIPNIKKGLSGCIYTQLSDVEDEQNGLFTFDRQVLKMDIKKMHRLNERMKKMVK